MSAQAFVEMARRLGFAARPPIVPVFRSNDDVFVHLARFAGVPDPRQMLTIDGLFAGCSSYRIVERQRAQARLETHFGMLSR